MTDRCLNLKPAQPGSDRGKVEEKIEKQYNSPTKEVL